MQVFGGSFKRFFIGWILFPTIILIFWYIGSKLSIFNSYIVPSPISVFRSFVRMVRSAAIFHNMFASLSRVFSGFFISTILSILLSVLFILFPKLFPIFGPTLDFIKHIPPLAIIPLLILFCGIGELSKIIVVSLASFFPIFLNLHQGILECDKKLLEVGKVAGMNQSKIIIKIIIPSVLPFLLVGLRLGLCYGWRSLVGSEMIAASSGIGYMIMEGRELSQSDVLFIGILTLGVVGVLFDKLFFYLTYVFVPYRRNKGLNDGSVS